MLFGVAPNNRAEEQDRSYDGMYIEAAWHWLWVCVAMSEGGGALNKVGGALNKRGGAVNEGGGALITFPICY